MVDIKVKDIEFVSMDDGDGGRRRTDEIGQPTTTTTTQQHGPTPVCPKDLLPTHPTTIITPLDSIVDIMHPVRPATTQPRDRITLENTSIRI